MSTDLLVSCNSKSTGNHLSGRRVKIGYCSDLDKKSFLLFSIVLKKMNGNKSNNIVSLNVINRSFGVFFLLFLFFASDVRSP